MNDYPTITVVESERAKLLDQHGREVTVRPAMGFNLAKTQAGAENPSAGVKSPANQARG